MERYYRCKHCQDVYLCLVSGQYGYSTSHKDTQYCEECALVIRKALSTIPVKFERVWEKTGDVTLKQLLEWEKLNNAELDRQNTFPIRRISLPLLRIDGQNVSEIQKTAYVRGRDEFKGRHFNYRYWDGEEDNAEITEELELNVKTGKTTTWVNYS